MNIEYDNELNERLRPRNIPSNALQPLYDFRPVSTKYEQFQIKEERPSPTINYEYSQDVFNPGNRAPPNYYFQNIDKESTLRNQFFALQKSDQAVYVPELNSNLYENPMAYIPSKFSPTVATTQTCDKDTSFFYNHIRTNNRK